MGGKKDLEYYDEIFDSGECIKLNVDSIKNKQVIFDKIDAIRNQPHTKEIRIMGLRQDSFEYFIDNYGQQFMVISFWKCPLISDFMILKQLNNVEYLLFFWNQRVTHLWDLSKNSQLKGISLNDFTRMHTLEEIPLAPALEQLYFGDKIWTKYVLESLKPLCNAPRLKVLSFAPKKIIDNDITPLARIKSLRKLEFSTNLFTTEQVAWLTANVKNIKSSVLAPYRKVKYPIEHNGKKLDVIVIGKRKPLLDSKRDKIRLEKYAKNFNELVNKYRNEPKPL